jgi:hypothetical protein
MQRFLRAFRSLPRARFEHVTGPELGGEVVIAEARAEGRYWIYLANPGPFDLDAVVTLAGPGTITRATDGRAVAAPGGKLAVQLEPYDLLPFSGPEEVLRPKAAAARACDWARAYVQQTLRACRETLGDPARTQRLSESSLAAAHRHLDAAQAALAAGQINAAWEHLTPVLESKSP